MTTATALDFLTPAASELIRELTAGKAVAALAAELAEDDTEATEQARGELTEAEIEAGLWSLLSDKIEAAAVAAGEEAAGQGGEADEWPAQGVVPVEDILEQLGQREAPRSVTRQADKAFRAAYAKARA